MLTNQKLAQDHEVPLNYYAVLETINQNLPNQHFIITEGSNTMDIARSMVLSNKPLKRLDAATFGTMGVGLGQAISAALTYPEDKIVLIQGDSAFGFSAMDVETIARYKLNVAIYILNNNGITRGVDKIEEGQSPDPVCLLPGSKYELMADAFGGRGYSIETIPRLIEVCKEVNSYKGVTIANIKIDPYGGRRPQSFEWLTTSKL